MRLQTGIELGENGSNFPRPKGASHGRVCYIGIGHRALLASELRGSIGAGKV